MYKYNVSFTTFGTFNEYTTSVYSSKNNLSTGMSDTVRGLVASRESLDLKKINKIVKVEKC